MKTCRAKKGRYLLDGGNNVSLEHWQNNMSEAVNESKVDVTVKILLGALKLDERQICRFSYRLMESIHADRLSPKPMSLFAGRRKR